MATDTNTPNVEGGSTPSENSQASGLPNYNPNHIASVVDGEGSTTKYSYNPLDKDFGGDGSSHSVIGEAGTVKPSLEPAQRVAPDRASQEARTNWSINPRQGEKPTEILGDSIKKEPDDPKLRDAMNKYWESKGTKESDSADELGKRQNNASAYRMAELKKISNYVSQQIERIKEPGNLTDKEKVVLLNKHMSEKSEEYVQKKTELESKGLSKEDIGLILENHSNFKDEVDKYKRSVSRKRLNDDEIKVVEMHYKNELIREHNQDAEARDFQSSEERRLERDEVYKQQNNIEKEKAHQNDFTDALPDPITESTLEPAGNGFVLVDSEPEGNGSALEVVPENNLTIIEGDIREIDKNNNESKRKERNIRKAALIGGVVGGGSIGLIGGVPAAGVASLVSIGVGIGNKILEKVGQNKVAKLKEQLNTVPNEEEKAKIDRKIKVWEKVVKVTEYATQFLKGFKYGLLGSSIISGAFMGGQGLKDFIGPKPEVIPTASIPNQNPTAGPTQATSPIGQPVTGAPTGAENLSPMDTGLIQNGRVNLPGSRWDGNLAGNPDMGASDLLSSSFAGGQTNMAAFQLNSDLAQAGLKLSDVTGKMGTGGVHQLLNGYFNAIRSGVANPTLESILSSTNVQGASDVLSMIK